jgi:hypothetical protein
MLETTAHYYLPKLKIFSLLEINKNVNGFPANFKTNDFFERLKNLRYFNNTHY